MSDDVAQGGTLKPLPSKKTPSKGGSFWTPSRIGIAIFALIALVIVIVELRARTGYTSSVQSIEAALADTDEGGEGISRDKLDEHISGSPQREAVGESAERFTWSGVMKSYRFSLQYAPNGYVVSIKTE